MKSMQVQMQVFKVIVFRNSTDHWAVSNDLEYPVKSDCFGLPFQKTYNLNKTLCSWLWDGGHSF